MNRARWYSSSTMLLNGEVYIQGGSGGTDLPEVRAPTAPSACSAARTPARSTSCTRATSSRRTAASSATTASAGCTTSTPTGTGSITSVGQFGGPTGSDASAAMFRPGRILQFGGNSNGAVVIDITRRRTDGDADAARCLRSAAWSTPRSWPTARCWPPAAAGLERADQRQQQRRDLGSEHRHVDRRLPRRTARGCITRRAVLMPDATVLVAGGGAPGPQNNLNFEVYYPPYLYDASGEPGAAADHRLGAVGRRHRPDLLRRRRPRRPHRPRGDDQDRGS